MENNYLENPKLKTYISLLLQWQKKLNLVSSKSIEYLWDRHVKDSLGLISYLGGPDQKIFDLGSGAGFPGLVLAICAPKNHYLLVDSNSKKTTFLNVVKAQLNLANVTIINDRIENLYDTLKADIIVSRALASIENLLIHSNKLLKKNGKAIFLKGDNLLQELDQVHNKMLLKNYSFDIFNNSMNNNGKIIILKKQTNQ